MDQDCICDLGVQYIYIYIYITHMILHFMVFNMLPRAIATRQPRAFSTNRPYSSGEKF